MRPAQRLLILAFGAAAAAALLAACWRASVVDASGNGGAHGRSRELRRRVDAARERLRQDLERARQE